MQQKLRNLNRYSRERGLNISIAKTKLLRLNAVSSEKIRLDENFVDDVESFTYLGARVNKTGGTEDDIKERIGRARTAYNKLGKIWKNGQLTRKKPRSEY